MSRSVIVERDLRHPPHKVWRALTQGALIEDWLMKNDFQPVAGHKFQFRAEPMPHWDGIVDAEVLEVIPESSLAYRWDAAGGLRTVVTWTLEPVGTGTRLRMEQSGFTAEQEFNYRGATYGWQTYFVALERVVEGLAE